MNVSIQENSNPLEFYKLHSKHLPILSAIAKKIFSISPSSVPSERLFSKAGYTTWDRRNKLSPHKIDKMMIIYSYEKHFE